MNSDQKWIAGALLDALQTLKPNETPPMHTVNHRLALIDMVLTEVAGNDIEELSLLAIAESAQDLCLDSGDPDAIDRYRAALCAAVEIWGCPRPDSPGRARSRPDAG